MKWYYIESSRRVGPLDASEWEEAVRSGKVQPQTLVWHEGMGERWVPFAELPPQELPEEPPQVPELEEEELPMKEEAAGEEPLAFAHRVEGEDYKVEIGRCIAGAWACYRAHFWPLVVATFCAMALMLLSLAVPPLTLVLGGVVLGGLFLLYLRLMRGEPAGIANLLEGFRWTLFKPLALQTLVTVLLWMVCLMPVLWTTESMGLTEEKLRAGSLAGSFEGLLTPQQAQVLLLVLLSCLLPVIYFSFCWTFSIPLIVDKGLPFWTAMKLSLHKVLQHPWRVSVLLIFAGLLGIAGRLLLLPFLLVPGMPPLAADLIGMVGGIVTMPLYFLVTLRLYEAIFNAPSKKEGK